MNAVNLHHHDRTALDCVLQHVIRKRSLSGGNDMNALGRLCQLRKPSRSPVPAAVG
ncbi:hypothetical protein [Pseudomonas sp. QTF5]|uniref:hypothetical protein n=1 Tax=Pseudomonas sp. QTF5 TaxID=1435425 RepID=UPI002115B04A|nr:hypothetical protein [Pseudomonas sp. QTF5]